MRYFYLYQSSPIMESGQVWSIDFPLVTFPLGRLEDSVPWTNWDTSMPGVFPNGEIHQVDYPVTLTDWPVFSPRFQDLLNEVVPEHLQFLPFSLRSQNSRQRLDGWAVGQILRRVDCLDRFRTKVRNNDWTPINSLGDFSVQEPILLNRSLIGSERFFRVHGFSGRIVVREDFKKQIESAGMLGPVFEDVLIS